MKWNKHKKINKKQKILKNHIKYNKMNKVLYLIQYKVYLKKILFKIFKMIKIKMTFKLVKKNNLKQIQINKMKMI